MKVFISADIEGVTTSTLWDDTRVNDKPQSAAHQLQMTKEVLAACNGAIKAGATEIVIKDAHSSAINIIPDDLPECAELIRHWSGHPYAMVQGVDSSFDAALFIGYHSGAGLDGNPLSHTMSRDIFEIYINDMQASEFHVYSWACAHAGVPVAYLAGDKRLCGDALKLWPNLVTTAVKDGLGGSTRCLAPKKALRLIEEDVERALRQDLRQLKIRLPETFKMKIIYKEPAVADNASYFPGVRRVNDNTVLFESDDYFEVLRTLNFIYH